MLLFLLAKIRAIGTAIESLPYLSTVLNKSKQLAKMTPQIAKAIVCVIAIGFIMLKTPGVHDKLLRHYVGNKVYMIMGKQGGGTGFAYKAPSGQSYILTNDHICNLADEKGELRIIDNDGNSIPRRVIERSNFSDLCIVEGLPGVTGMSLGGEPDIGELVGALGHPALKPLILTKGEIVGRQDVYIMDHIMDPKNPADTCNLPKNQIIRQQLQIFIFTIDVDVCADVTRNAYVSSIPVFGGSSGSPVVNFWGHIVGVVFAMDDTHWASIVSLDDIKKFTANY